MSFDFPTSPTVGQASNGYTWDGQKWNATTASGGGGGGTGVTDGDKGDIVVSGSGATWLLDSAVVTAAAKTVLDDVSTAAMLVTLGGAPLVSPVFTGNPAAPTLPAAANGTGLATTAFVHAAIAADVGGPFAPLASPAFTGNPTAPTPTIGDSDTSIATTAFVAAAVAAGGGGGGAPILEQFFDLAGKTSIDIVVPSWAVGAKIESSVISAVGSSMRLSMDGSTFLAGASDYSAQGATHYTGAGASAYQTNTGIALDYMLFSPGGDANAVPHSITAEINLVRPAGMVFQLRTYSKSQMVAGATSGRTYWGQNWLTSAAAGANLAVKAIRVFTASAWGTGSYLSVHWIGDISLAGTGILPEAPSDGATYGRLNAAWSKALPLTGGTLTGNLVVAPPVVMAEFTIDDKQALSASNASIFNWKRGGNNRFAMFLDGGEPGNQTKSDWKVARYFDDGAFRDVVFSITRADATASFGAALSCGGAFTSGGDIKITKATPTISLDKTAIGQSSFLAFTTSGSSRWSVYTNAETGSANAGGDLVFLPCSDAGAALSSVQARLERSTGNLSVGGSIAAGTSASIGTTLTVTGSSSLFGQLTVQPAAPFVARYVYDNTAGATANVTVSSSGVFNRITSMRVLKTDIVAVPDAFGDAILALLPSIFRYKSDLSRTYAGFIAEDLALADPHFASWGIEPERDENGVLVLQEDGAPKMGEEIVPNGYDPIAIIAGLVNMVQRLERRISELESR